MRVTKPQRLDPVDPWYLAPTLLSNSTATIKTPASGKRLLLTRFSFSVSAATRIELRWAAAAFESFYLPANGSIIVNLISCVELGPVDAALIIYSSTAAIVTAKASGREV